jgi:hypothetical protein
VAEVSIDISLKCSLSKVKPSKEPIVLNDEHLGAFLLDLHMTQKKKDICSFEKLLNFNRTAECHILEASTLRSHFCENLRFKVWSSGLKLKEIYKISAVRLTSQKLSLHSHVIAGLDKFQPINFSLVTFSVYVQRHDGHTNLIATILYHPV